MQNKIEQKLSLHDHYQNLFTFIKYNKKLTKAIAKVSQSQDDMEQTNQLLTAIEKGDFTSSVFKNDKVDIFLLYLIKEKKIAPDNLELNFWTGMTVYLYILAQRQYGDPLSLISYPGKSNEKYPAKIEMLSFYSEGKLTGEGEAYLKALSQSLNQFKIKLDIQQASEFIRQLPPVEQSLMRLPHVSNKDIFTLLWGAADNLPFIHPTWNKKGPTPESPAYIPSLSILNYLFNIQSPRPLKIFPFFGSIGKETLCFMHTMGYHPLALGSNWVKSNYAAHGSTDSFAIAVHDFSHAFMGNLLNTSEYRLLFNHLIPKLKKWAQLAQKFNEEKFSEKLLFSVESLSDLNITNLRNYYYSSSKSECLLSFYSKELPHSIYDDFTWHRCLGFGKNYFNSIGSEEEKNLWLLLFAYEFQSLVQNGDKEDKILAKAILIALSKDTDIVEKLTEKLEKLIEVDEDKLTLGEWRLHTALTLLRKTSNMDYTTSLNEIKKLRENSLGYELVLMSSLPENDKNKAEKGKIYLSQQADKNGNYVLLDNKGIVRTGEFNKYHIKAHELESHLKDKNFIRQILEDTHKAGHTPKDYHVSEDWLTYFLKESSVKQLKNTGILSQQSSYFPFWRKPPAQNQLQERSKIDTKKNLWIS